MSSGTPSPAKLLDRTAWRGCGIIEIHIMALHIGTSHHGRNGTGIRHAVIRSGGITMMLARPILSSDGFKLHLKLTSAPQTSVSCTPRAPGRAAADRSQFRAHGAAGGDGL